MSDKEIYEAIDKTLGIITQNFKYGFGEKISYNELHEMIQDVYILFQNFEHNIKQCAELVIKRFIPILDLLIKIDTNPNHLVDYNNIIKYAYKLAARVSLEHYMVYREWDEPENEKFFEPRYNILVGYIHYLQDIQHNQPSVLLTK